GRGYRWDPSLTGRTVACRKCDHRFAVPDRPGLPGVSLAPAKPAAETYELDLSEAERHPGEPEPMAVPANNGKCPSCNSPIKDTAVICLNCGFNLREGNRIQTAVLAAP